MKRSLIIILTILAYLVAGNDNLEGQIEGFNKIRWKHDKVISGLIRKSSHTNLPGAGPQNINILLVNLRKREIVLQYNPSENLPVNLQAQSSEAVAAVNGGFFNIKEGGSVTYIRTGGGIQETDTANKWRRNANMNGSLLINAKGKISLEKAHANQWYDEHDEFPYVLLTGPLLLENNHATNLPETSLVTMKHPRTAIGVLGRNRVILVTIDGRTDSAAGMTLSELTGIMISLKCRYAINLDGGGSTTMWIRNEPDDGIVNMPCDNKKFDHKGARAVSDIVIVR